MTSPAPRTAPARGWVPSRADLDEAEATLRRFADTGTGGGHPGVAWGVVAGGALVRAGGHGARTLGGDVPDERTVFRIASMTKSFTATTVLTLRDAGLLALDDEVARWVPEATAVRPATADSPPLTVRHLLTMSGGLPTDDPWGDRQQALPVPRFRALVARGLSSAWPPGVQFEYSNLGFALLGLVVEAAGGAPYEQVVADRVLGPLGLAGTVYHADDVPAGMLATGYRVGDTGGVPPQDGGRWPHGAAADTRAGLDRFASVPYDAHGAFAPMGGLFSCVRDLAVWVSGFLDAFPARDEAETGHPLRRASRREMQQVHRAIPPTLSSAAVDEPLRVRGGGYGYGLFVEHDPLHGLEVSHSGGYPGFGTHMRWHPQTGLGVVVLSNTTYAPSSRVGQQVLEQLLEVRRRALRRPAGLAGAVEHAAPAPVGPWPATRAAMDAATRVALEGWSGAAGAALEELLAENVDLDEPVENRRAAWERARGQVAPQAPDDAPPTHSSPAQATWLVRGTAGRLRLTVLMTPHAQPLVQTLRCVPLPDLGDALSAAVRDLRTALDSAADPRVAAAWTPPRAGQALVAPDTLARVRRQLLTAAARIGRTTGQEVTGGDGVRTATVLVAGVHGDVVVGLTVAETGVLRELSFAWPDQTPV